MFKKGRKTEYQCNISILGNILKQENQIMYLGIIITNDMALDKDIEFCHVDFVMIVLS